ncbi:hypothetical protein ANTPLA_LOCUS3981 [Anthophora plagiata]
MKFQRDSAPSHKVRKMRAWLHGNLCHHWFPDLWPFSSPDCIPLDYYMWVVVEAKANANPHNTKILRASIMEVMTIMDKKEVK